MSQQNIELVRNGYRAFASGDTATLMALFDEDIEWIQPGDSGVSGTYRGKAELGMFLMRLGEKSPTITPHSFLADGDRVVALSEASVGGESAQSAEVYTIRNGKTVRVQVYGDTAMMERHYGRKSAAAI
ncbi:nuclear transport factor 2 family protein [[Mycobacterium] nativiensis]|uniref:Nuclear transport factor 2 family protein n=1 Tax=[Mycobacterium] nativiensis TaxID=2855503 RepID=A0ABU5XXB2_9MYCO|nr:nuclear transport factor 2 family protein [Mycolicibacter sp. MYC340]MEB3032641.1 nuclear transport factor 2 family protein [Mycolicibacter sp. MYC340]